jgi:hypothetical protein
MYDIEGGFFIRIVVVEGGLRRDKDLAEEIFIEGEGNAVGGSRVLEVFGVESGDFFLGDEVDGDLLADDFFLLEEKLDESPHRREFDRQVRLSIGDVYATAGVLGSPVTLVFSPSFHLPTFRRTSIRSYRFRTFRFFADLLALP